MAHSDKYISSVKLPGSDVVYEIHDEKAIHDISDLNLATVLIFGGTVKTEDEIFSIATAKMGTVYLATDSNTEYVCTKDLDGEADSTAWEMLGKTYDASSSTHKHTVTVTGTNAASSVDGTATVPTYAATKKYMSATATAPTATPSTKNVLGTSTTFTASGGAAQVSTTMLDAVASGTAVGANGTANAITALGAAETASAITALNTTTIKNPTVTAVSIPNVTNNATVVASKVTTEDVTASKITSNTDVKATKISSYGSATTGTAASWGASVTNGVLEFNWSANTPTQVTMPTGSDVTASKVAASNVTASVVSASDVSASKVTLGTNLSASNVTTANVTVATGSKSTANAIIGFGDHTTKTVLTGVKVTAQPTITLSTGDDGDVEVVTDVVNSAITVAPNGDNNVAAMTGVTMGKPTVTLSTGASESTGSAAVVSDVTLGSTTVAVSGTAAAQKWTQGTVTVSIPQ